MAKQPPFQRYLCSELVSVVRVHKNGGSQFAAANLEEIGERTAVVLSDLPISIGSSVHIACRGHILKGVAKASESHPALGYFTKIELARTSRWSPKWFKPRHLVSMNQYQVRLCA
jgi:hypothetical protein